MTLDNIIEMFPTTPYLFVGSGLTRRYYGLPSWEELLKHFAGQISEDEFAYNAFVSEAREINPDNFMPETASLIQKAYDQLWYSTPQIRTQNAEALAHVRNGVSPFKVEIAEYLKSISNVNPKYYDEIELLKEMRLFQSLCKLKNTDIRYVN